MRTRLLATIGCLLAAMLCASPGSARDDIRIGITGTFTGPAAAIGIPYKQASELFPAKVAGRPVTWIVLDDGGDPGAALKNARRFTDEDKVDAILGSTSPPGSMAIFDVASETKTPQLSLAPVPIPDAKRTWLFNIPQAVPIMVSAIVDHMAANKVKSVGFIGFTDSWGDQNYGALVKLAGEKGIKVVGNERYNRVDTSVTAQALKIFSENPDVVFIGGSASPAVLPHLALRDLGYKGQIYHSHGSVSRPVLQAGGKSLEGSIAPTGPVIVADELPESHPTKKAALDFIRILRREMGQGHAQSVRGICLGRHACRDGCNSERIEGRRAGQCRISRGIAQRHRERQRSAGNARCIPLYADRSLRCRSARSCARHGQGRGFPPSAQLAPGAR